MGDTLQFIRYVDLLRPRDGKVLVEVPGALMPLLKTSGFSDVLAQGAELPSFDVRVPLLSLPGIFHTTLANLPAPLGYLTADPRLLETWRAGLAAFEGFKVGIHWQGRRAFALDHQRSIPLREFAPLAAVDSVRLFSLQKGEGTEQLAELAGPLNIHDFGSGLDSQSGAFMDTAAVLRNLDLVITSDTATAHLAGGLGVPVWLALSRWPDWRWFLDRADTPWYPTMRLFRQRTAGNWAEPFTEMAAALAEAVAADRD
jgi:hypothetical protein